MRFTKLFAPLGLLLATMAPAMAQVPGHGEAYPVVPAPVYTLGVTDWPGFYLGANVGGGFGNTTISNNATDFTSNSKLNSSGPVGGVQGGYNWIFAPNWLAGIEADFDGSGIGNRNSAQFRTFPDGSTSTGQVSRSMEWLGTVRGRIGYSLFQPGWLTYVTGGFAYGEVHTRAFGSVTGATFPASTGIIGPQNFGFNASKSGVQTGWTVGAGEEIPIAPQFSLVLQYLYTDLGSFSLNLPATSPNPTVAHLISQGKNNISVDNNSNIFRIGINYHFYVPPPPPAPVAVPAPPPAAPKVFIVFFDWDKDVITPEGQAIIQQAADAYKAGAPVQLQVTGYTDRSGSPGYNQRLSERRANNVARALAALGVPRDQMIVAGRGENDNRVPTAPGVREPQNRRVEIVAP
jgi:opacity protein-like surface antigen